MHHRSLPTPAGHPLWGNWQQYSKNPMQFMVDMCRTYDDAFRIRLATTYIYVFNRPDMIHEVLAKQANRFHKDRIQKKLLGRFIGNGLTINDGEPWKRQRRLIQPAFHAKRLNLYMQEMIDQIVHMMSDWQDGSIIEIHQEMTKVTLNIVAKVLFGADVAAAHTIASPELYAAIAIFFEKTVGQQAIPFLIPSWLPTSSNRTLQHVKKMSNRLVLNIIHKRRAVREQTDDLLSMLLLARDEDGSQMTDTQIRDEVLTILIAGQHTTANALTWTWYLLSQHPECEAQLLEEIDRVLGKRLPTMEDFQHLRYADMVLKEALRLYPSAWLMSRQATEDVIVGGYHVPKGTIVAMSPYVLHRDPRWFEQPEQFRPERFSEENEKLIPNHVYIPFGSGPHACIGSRFAMIEESLIVAMVIQRYRLSLVPDQRIELQPLIGIHPKYGIHMQVHMREE